jgi:hypothetical protein
LHCSPVYFAGVLPCIMCILLFSASTAFAFHHVALLSTVLHSFSASRAAAVTLGRGILGLAFFVGVVGGVMVIGSLLGHGTRCRFSALSVSCATVAVCCECIRPCPGDASRHRCSSCQCVVGDFSLVSSCPLLGTHFRFPTGLRTASSTSWMSFCTLYSCIYLFIYFSLMLATLRLWRILQN